MRLASQIDEALDSGYVCRFPVGATDLSAPT
jgi:hypothetical protein